MKVLIADQQLVTELLPMDEAITVMRRALTLLAEGDVLMPLRTSLHLPVGGAVMAVMPSYVGGLEAVGVKVIAEFRPTSVPSSTPTRASCCSSIPSAACCGPWWTPPR